MRASREKQSTPWLLFLRLNGSMVAVVMAATCLSVWSLPSMLWNAPACTLTLMTLVLQRGSLPSLATPASCAVALLPLASSVAAFLPPQVLKWAPTYLKSLTTGILDCRFSHQVSWSHFLATTVDAMLKHFAGATLAPRSLR